MFSNDKNIDTVSQLIQLIKEHVGLQKEYIKLDIIEKTVRLTTALLLFILLLVIVVAVFTYLSFAAAYALGPVFGLPVAFCMVAAFYALIFILVFNFRKKWIERPLVRFIATLLME